jgi:hypothetical protein
MCLFKQQKILETRKGSGSGNWKHDTFSFGLLWTKCRLTLISRSLILLIVEKWAQNVEFSFLCFDTPFIWPILFINVTKLICTRFKQSFIFGMLASHVVWKDAYDYQGMNLSNLTKKDTQHHMVSRVPRLLYTNDHFCRFWNRDTLQLLHNAFLLSSH